MQNKNCVMRIFYIIILLLLLQVCKLDAQPVTRPLSSNNTTKDPLVMVDTFVTSIKYFIIDPGKIESINVYKDTAAINKFGNAGKEGAIIIHTKDGVNLLRLGPLFDKYGFPDSLRHYRVCVDEVLIKSPELLLIDESQINGIGTFVSVNWNDLRQPKDEKFINVTTKNNGLYHKE
jgi:hypothetical protein